jgi:hypothetical protein
MIRPPAAFSLSPCNVTLRGAATKDCARMLKPNPFLINSFALMEQIARANRLAVGKSARVIAVRLGAGDTATVTVSRPHADSVVVDAPQGAVRMAVSSDGDVMGAIFPAQQWVIERRKGGGGKP